jgi:hypothetical protein
MEPPRRKMKMNNENNEKTTVDEPVIVLTNERTVQINTSSINFDTLHQDLDALKMRSNVLYATLDKVLDGTIKEEDLNEYIEQCTQYLITQGLFRVTDYIGTSDKNKVAAQLIMNCVSTISSLMYCAAKHEDTETETGGEAEANVPDDDVVPDNTVVQTIMGEPNNG